MKKLMIHAAVAGVAALAIACNSSGNGNNTSSRTAENRATLTGCLQSGGDDGSFVLKLASAADTSTQGTAGSTPTAAGDSASGRAYRVVPGKNDDLSKLVDSRVTINGYVENGVSDTVGTSGSRPSAERPASGSTSSSDTAGTSGSSSTRNSGAAGATSGASDEGNMTVGSGMQTLVAESVRKLSDRCIDGGAEQGAPSNR